MEVHDRIANAKKLLEDLSGKQHWSNEMVSVLRELTRAVELVAAQQTELATTQITKLELKPGDVLLAKLGDPATGWIPGPDAETRLQGLIEQAFEIADISNKVAVVTWNYGVDAQVVRAPAS